MRRYKGLIWILFVGVGLFLIYGEQSPVAKDLRVAVQAQLNNTYQWGRDSLQNLISNRTATTRTNETASSVAIAPSQTPSNQAEPTPISAIVKDVHLSATYTYNFQAGTPENVKALFQQAVATFNHTEIVHLVQGQPVPGYNHITLGSYNEGSRSSNTMILGKGGPRVTVGVISKRGFNEGQAEVNLAYPKALALSVATHELGHALGLDHSKDQKSLMFPVDQGVTTLTPADRVALQAIYPSN